MIARVMENRTNGRNLNYKIAARNESQLHRKFNGKTTNGPMAIIVLVSSIMLDSAKITNQFEI